MLRTDKWLFLLVTALICLSIAWFARFSQAQCHRTYNDAVVQLLDAITAESAGFGLTRPQRAGAGATSLTAYLTRI